MKRLLHLSLLVQVILLGSALVAPAVRGQDGGEAVPTIVEPLAAASPTPEPTAVPVTAPTATSTPEPTPAPANTPALERADAATPTPTPEATQPPATPTATPSPAKTATPTPTQTATPAPTATERTESSPTPTAVTSSPAASPTPTPTSSPTVAPEVDVLFRNKDGTRDRDGADLGRVRIGGGRRVLPAAASVTVRSETRWSLSVSTSGPLTNQTTGDVIPLQRFQWRLSGTNGWTAFRSGSTAVLTNQPSAPNGRLVVLDYSIITRPTDSAGRYETNITYTISAAP